MLKLVKNATSNPKNQAIISDNQSYTYKDLLDFSHQFASLILKNTVDLNEIRVAFIVSPGFDYVSVQWGIWRAGGIAVPLCISYPLPSLQYVIEDTRAEIVIVGACTYIVGPVTGAAIGANSDVMALSIAAGVVKAVAVTIGTPFIAKYIGLNNPHTAMVFGGLMGTISGVTAGLAATDPKLVPYGALTARFGLSVLPFNFIFTNENDIWLIVGQVSNLSVAENINTKSSTPPESGNPYYSFSSNCIRGYSSLTIKWSVFLTKTVTPLFKQKSIHFLL